MQEHARQGSQNFKVVIAVRDPTQRHPTQRHQSRDQWQVSGWSGFFREFINTRTAKLRSTEHWLAGL
jgi:hypothetical protein